MIKIKDYILIESEDDFKRIKKSKDWGKCEVMCGSYRTTYHTLCEYIIRDDDVSIIEISASPVLFKVYKEGDAKHYGIIRIADGKEMKKFKSILKRAIDESEKFKEFLSRESSVI